MIHEGQGNLRKQLSRSGSRVRPTYLYDLKSENPQPKILTEETLTLLVLVTIVYTSNCFLED